MLTHANTRGMNPKHESEAGMSFLTPYVDTSHKENGTNPQGSEERGEELFYLKSLLLPQRSRSYMSLLG